MQDVVLQGVLIFEYAYRGKVRPSEHIGLGVRSVGKRRLTPEAVVPDDTSVVVADFASVLWGVEGTGRFSIRDEHFDLKAEEVLVVSPGDRPPVAQAISPEWEYRFFTVDGPEAGRTLRELRLWTGVFRVGPAPIHLFENLEKILRGSTEADEREGSAVAFKLLRIISQQRRQAAPDVLVEQAQELIQSLWSDTQLSVSDIADALDVHRATLAQHFKREIGVSVWQYITKVRMQHALRLLDSGKKISITRVAHDCGYAGCAQFTRAFCRFYGKRPTDFRTG